MFEHVNIAQHRGSARGTSRTRADRKSDVLVPITKFSILALTIFLMNIATADRTQAETAPIPRAVVSASAAPEAMADRFTQLMPGENPISVAGAKWLQLKFADFQLGTGGLLTISSADLQSQTFTQQQLEDWEGLSAVFNGSELTVTLSTSESAPGVQEEISATIEEIIIGLPGRDATGLESMAPQPLRELLGDDLEKFIPDDSPRQPILPEGAAPTEGSTGLEAICGSTDNRVATNHPFVGRIMPIGCTGWLIQGGAVLTAGHCISSSTQTLEFNVPASQSDGTTVSPPVSQQYKVITSSIVEDYTGVGNDWALFQVLPNTETGLMPIEVQGGAFQLSNTANPTNVRITGFGLDGPPPKFGSGSGAPRNADNQTNQTHSGAVTNHTPSAPSSATLRYTVDTQGGNSGSPVIIEGGGNVAIGIHTNGGCTASGGSNAGTSFRNQALWAAIGVGTDDIVWQHRNGQVHYWPMQNGQRQGGINIHSPVGGDWRLIGAGDVNGDGTDDIVWQHRLGQVHYWPMQNGQRQGGINIHNPVDGNWNAIGVGDVNGDGTDDIVWQHRLGQVHYWPIQNGQRQGGINIHSPVSGDWTLSGVGDVNGDGTDDIVWQHRSGQVHYWPMQNGQRQGGINIHNKVSGNWRLEGVGDVNGDGTDDIVWQHRSGQVHFWPMQNGQRQGGINIHSPVGGDWSIRGVGNVD